MEFDYRFIKNAFYHLSVSDLPELELSLLFYLFSRGSNCFDSFVVKPSELSLVFEKKEEQIVEALFFLQEKKILKLKQNRKENSSLRRKSLAVVVNEDYESWDLPKLKESARDQGEIDARKQKDSSDLNLIRNKTFSQDRQHQAYLLSDFYRGVKNLPDSQKDKTTNEANALLEKYSFEALLFLLKHSYESIKSLGDLYKNWDQYQKELQEKLCKIDFVAARKQHKKDDKALVEVTKKWLLLAGRKKLNSEEVRILEILIENDHPRRQLFWAYRYRTNYPNLSLFFEENLSRMLPVTTTGKLVKKKS